MERVVSPEPANVSGTDPAVALCVLYDRALPHVYGYFAKRCGSAPVAEDLTSETFMAAVDAVRRERVPDLSEAWLIGVARHKLVDHWRREAREESKLALAADDDTLDDWDVRLDALRAHDTLAELFIYELRNHFGLSLARLAVNAHPVPAAQKPNGQFAGQGDRIVVECEFDYPGRV